MMKKRLRSKVWWPGIDKESKRFFKECYGCQLVSKPTAPEPINCTKLPQEPWQDLACDLLRPLLSGDWVFVLVDYFSSYFDIAVMEKVTSVKILLVLKKCLLVMVYQFR